MTLEAFVTDRVGRTVDGRWVLLRALGAGGMAAVYEARGPAGEVVAIKILHPEMAVRGDVRERFLREGLVANRIQHPGAVRVLQQGSVGDDCVYLVMELLRGETVAERATRQRAMTTAELLPVLDAVLDVLAAAHSLGIVHRDIKPDNLFITEQGAVKVLDFGLVRLLDAVPGDYRTRSGLALGTFPYMAPEQALGRHGEIDGRVDLFALGATAFRIVARRRIHEAPSEAELLMAMASKPAPPLASVAPDAPEGLCRVVDLALAFAKEARYPDARTMQADVRALLRGEPPAYAVSRAVISEEPTSVGLAAGGVADRIAATERAEAPTVAEVDPRQPLGSGRERETQTPAAGASSRPRRAILGVLALAALLIGGALLIGLGVAAAGLGASWRGGDNRAVAAEATGGGEREAPPVPTPRASPQSDAQEGSAAAPSATALEARAETAAGSATGPATARSAAAAPVTSGVATRSARRDAGAAPAVAASERPPPRGKGSAPAKRPGFSLEVSVGTRKGRGKDRADGR